MFNFSQNNSFNDILNRCLSRISDTLDKRQGSIIYDALAPACAELAQCYIALDVYADQTYLLTATGDNLDNRVADYGITRNPATYSKRLIQLYDIDNSPLDTDIGTRFSVPNEFGGYNYILVEKISDGNYIGECETAGTAGNEYLGNLLPLVSVNNLGIATLSTILKPGEDEETDDDLRERTITKINQEAFSGNKAAYIRFARDIDGVEKVKIFPIWNGGGTVKIAIITSNNTIPSSDFINNVQELIDPIQNQGQGVGIAPIGHTVTVVAPTKLDIDISATITPKTGYTIEQLQSNIETAISNYIAEVQDNWEDDSDLIIYSAKVIAAILSVSQVENVTNLTINEQAQDLIINITGTDVKFPILNEVILNEN